MNYLKYTPNMIMSAQTHILYKYANNYLIKYCLYNNYELRIVQYKY